MYNIEELKKIVIKMKIILFLLILLFIIGFVAGIKLLFKDPNGFVNMIPFIFCIIDIFWIFDTYKEHKEMNNILKQIIRGT